MFGVVDVLARSVDAKLLRTTLRRFDTDTACHTQGLLAKRRASLAAEVGNKVGCCVDCAFHARRRQSLAGGRAAILCHGEAFACTLSRTERGHCAKPANRGKSERLDNGYAHASDCVGNTFALVWSASL